MARRSGRGCRAEGESEVVRWMGGMERRCRDGTGYADSPQRISQYGAWRC